MRDMDRTISVERTDEGRPTFATCVILQEVLAICSRSCLISSGRMGDLKEPRLAERM